MWCLTKEDSRKWCEGHGFTSGREGYPVINQKKHSAVTYFSEKNWSQLTWFSGFLTSYLQPFRECLLWVTEWGVWPSSENLHLFYRLRESYDERRSLHDAPGHSFLGYENADLTTYIQVALQFGWGFYLVTSPSHHSAFVSHDEYVDFYTDDPDVAEKARHCLEPDADGSMSKPE
jgi:hypothetical protein